MFIMAKITAEQLVDTIRIVKTKKGIEQHHAMNDLIEFFKPLISGQISKIIKINPMVYGRAKEDIKNYILSEFTLILLKDVDIDQLRKIDIGKAINFIDNSLSSRINKGNIDKYLGISSMVTEKIEYFFNQVLRKFHDKYHKEPVLEKGNPDLTKFTELWKGQDEEGIMDIVGKMGKHKIKSLYDKVSDEGEDDEAMMLINVLKSDEPLPDEILKNKEVKETLTTEMKKLLDDTEYKVLTLYYDPFQEHAEYNKKDIAKQLKIKIKDVNRALGNAKKKLVNSPEIIKLVSSRIVTLIKVACNNFEVVESKGMYKIARKTEEKLIKEIVNAKRN